MKVDFTLNTDGKGYWTTESRPVHINDIRLNYFADDDGIPHGELIASYDNWNPDEHGLIYTDELWIEQFQAALVSLGVPISCASDVDYSEQGMQGKDYVSMDVDSAFFSNSNPLIHELMMEWNNHLKLMEAK